MAVLGTSQVAAVPSNTSSSVSFSSGGAPSMAFVRARSVRPLRATGDNKRDMSPDSPSSTGGISEKAKEVAEKTAAVFDGVKEDVESKLKDDGRDLRSKTGDVVYGAQRNAEGVGNDAMQKAMDAQTKFTKGKE